jgi:hypothetical protein
MGFYNILLDLFAGIVKNSQSILQGVPPLMSSKHRETILGKVPIKGEGQTNL